MNFTFPFFKNTAIKQLIFKNTFWLWISEVLSRAPLFFLNVFIARYLGAEDYGKFVFSFTLVSLFSVLTDLGLSTLIIREVAKEKRLARKYIDNLIILKSVLTFCTLVLIFGVIQFLGKSSEIKGLVYLWAVFLVITSFTTLFQSIFQAFEKMEYLAFSKLVYSLLLTIMAFLTIRHNLGLKVLTLGYILTALITFIFVLVLIRKKFTEFFYEIDFSFLKNALREAWPFGLIGLVASIYFSMNLIQIGLISQQSETAFYNIAYQPILILTALIGLLFSALFPTLSKEYQNSKINFYHLIDYFAKKVIFFSLAICLILFLSSKEIILRFYGPDYLKSVEMLKILSISIFILLLNTTYSEALKMAGYQKDYFNFLLLGTAFGFFLNFPLISFFGGRGAAISTIFSSLTITITMILKFKNMKKNDLYKLNQ